MRFILSLLVLLIPMNPSGAQEQSSCRTYFLFEKLARQGVTGDAGTDVGPILKTAEIQPLVLTESGDTANVSFDFTAWAEEEGLGTLSELDRETARLQMWDAAVRYAAFLVRAEEGVNDPDQVAQATGLPMLPTGSGPDLSCHLQEIVVLAAGDTLGWMGIPDCQKAMDIENPALRLLAIQEAIRGKPGGEGGE